MIGFVENGERALSCRNREYTIKRGHVLLFNPGDNHACVQSGSGSLDYRGFNITKEVMLDLVGEVTGKRDLPGFSQNVIYDEEVSCCLRPLHELVMKGSGEFGKEEGLLLLISLLVQKYSRPFAGCVLEYRDEIDRACAFMEQHYAERICLDQICRCVGLSRSTLLRAFAKSKGVTPYSYLENIRIGKARKLLEQGVTPIEAALQTGFPTRAILPTISAALLDCLPASTGKYSQASKRGKRPMKTNHTLGHLASLLTICIWGTTFVSTKILLVDFQPVEILFFRFVMGLIALLLVYPRRLKGTSRSQELSFAAAGLCGVCLYYLLENIALTYALASNVGVIISVSPFFTGLLSHLLLKEEKPKANFFLGFAVAMAGIVLISFNGSRLELSPAGDLLALLAALVWALYSVLTKKISGYGYHTILTTRRIFFYGLLFMIPALFLFDFELRLSRFADSGYLFNIIFLGLGASALCFVTWNFAVKVLGAVKTSIYLYMVPVITVVTSVLILHEQITVLAACGTILTLVGLFLSESKLLLRKGKKKNGLTK